MFILGNLCDRAQWELQASAHFAPLSYFSYEPLDIKVADFFKYFCPYSGRTLTDMEISLSGLFKD